MMVSPKMYIKQLKDKSYNGLIKEKENLINEMKNLDKNDASKPSNDTICFVYKEYIKELNKLIKNKSNVI